MHPIYYAWVIQHISQLIKMTIPKELIVMIANLTITNEYMITNIDFRRITTTSLKNSIAHMHYNNHKFLLRTHKFKSTGIIPIRWMHNNIRIPDHVAFHCNDQLGCINLKQFMSNINNLLELTEIKKQLFGQDWNQYLYRPYFMPSQFPADQDSLQKHTEMNLYNKPIQLIRIVDNNEENIPFTGIEHIQKIITYGTDVVIIFSLKIWTGTYYCRYEFYGVTPEIVTIKFFPQDELY